MSTPYCRSVFNNIHPRWWFSINDIALLCVSHSFRHFRVSRGIHVSIRLNYDHPCMGHLLVVSYDIDRDHSLIVDLPLAAARLCYIVQQMQHAALSKFGGRSLGIGIVM
ncbi:hypothetical protein IG631_17929 [Alternaria alternata]|nr:hypothetical protein IG631_17929 [Alternaria alternata]